MSIWALLVCGDLLIVAIYNLMVISPAITLFRKYVDNHNFKMNPKQTYVYKNLFLFRAISFVIGMFIAPVYLYRMLTNLPRTIRFRMTKEIIENLK